MADEVLAEALAAVEEAANEAWKEHARAAVRLCAQELTEFTTDEVWLCLSALPEITTHEPRALGPIMLWAMRQKIIQRATCPTCGSHPTKKSSRVEHHQHPLAVYTRGLNA